jgi:lipopolysaccharide-induced tumor necrosis factor-alpha factor
VQGVTTTEYTPGMATYASAGVICLFGLWAGCCLIPFCVDQCKDVEVSLRSTCIRVPLFESFH